MNITLTTDIKDQIKTTTDELYSVESALDRVCPILQGKNLKDSLNEPSLVLRAIGSRKLEHFEVYKLISEILNCINSKDILDDNFMLRLGSFLRLLTSTDIKYLKEDFTNETVKMFISIKKSIFTRLQERVVDLEQNMILERALRLKNETVPVSLEANSELAKKRPLRNVFLKLDALLEIEA